ncbi:helix-turn-helix transcriptional regulator [Sporosarcina sp. FSL W7-1283]|uniref:helix-turn-helix transcriptional regulator n=1 Tax=Sporosarcina sp. FSL W7-1283 TaxID=2921560 RepID=UPI004046C753
MADKRRISVNNYIKARRLEMRWTQDVLAEKLDVSRQTIISLEKGKYNPSLILAFKIAALFDCRIEDIFIYEEE